LSGVLGIPEDEWGLQSAASLIDSLFGFVRLSHCHNRTENDEWDNIDYVEVSWDFLQMDLR
jgi:hypothetical protein